jgi:hypothetical protein
MSAIKKNHQFIFAIILIVLASITRFIPHPFNFTAVGAMALFAGANFRDKKFAFLLPILVMFITDAILGFHFSMVPVYACFAFTVWMGWKISSRQSVFSIVSASLISSVVFFLITNLPIWYADLSLYPVSIKGTLESYTMALPFFWNQISGDLFYNLVLFGCYYIVVKKSEMLGTEETV